MRDTVKCALRNLGRQKSRTALTITSIAIGVTSVVLISTIGAVGKNAVNQEFNSLGIGSLAVSVDKQRTDMKLQEGDLKAIEQLEDVESAVPIMMEYSSLSMRGLVANVAIWGVDAGANQIMQLEPLYGNLFRRGDIVEQKAVCLVDTNTAVGFYGRENIVGKKLKLSIGGGYEEFEIIGVVNSGGNAMQSLIGEYLPMFVYVPYTTMQTYAGLDGFEQIAVKVRDEIDTEVAAEKIVRGLEIRNEHLGAFKAENIAKQKEKLDHMMELIAGILSAIAGISMVVAGLGIMTLMLVNVNERTREIGIKKSIGASRSVILWEFLIEAAAISLLGSLIGTAAGVALAAAGCWMFKIEFLLNYKMILFSVLFAVISGVIFGAYPSWIAAKLKPVDALRYE
ncbi:ABC transporter permease [Clostridiaceae bacterium NSJ-31]|uniref:ABC transporter permease n=3 Tax=Ligaoa zhengdingensis TaxID=2763658 RepID=A0A926DUA7_9FIRM|nr:ABC transporter permease [Ligaoa zhengdingensis]MBC8545410.1 ABC transporter permease [Ligaoa zhengdingensis]